MLLLVGTTEKMSVVTDQAVAVDSHVSYIDYNGTVATPGRKNTAISTATTTDITGSPGSSVQRNVRTVNIRNKDTTTTVNVTVTHFDGTTTVELIKVGLAPGETLEYLEGVGFFKVPLTSANPTPQYSTSDQNPTAGSAVYITGSDVHIPVGRALRVGTIIEWFIAHSKTAVGTASSTWDSRWGTAGTTGDTSRANVATGAQTAVADQGELHVRAMVRSLGVSGVVSIFMKVLHGLSATGLGATPIATSLTVATFDITSSSLVMGISLNAGATEVYTVSQVKTTVENLG